VRRFSRSVTFTVETVVGALCGRKELLSDCFLISIQDVEWATQLSFIVVELSRIKVTADLHRDRLSGGSNQIAEV
jgi:hypothetical protein